MLLLGGFTACGAAALLLWMRLAPPTAGGPPAIVVRCRLPDASARKVAESVAVPIEEEVNDIEGTTRLSSYSHDDGAYELTVTFAPGTDLSAARVLVQGRIDSALAKLPDTVKLVGVSTRAKAVALMRVAVVCPNGKHDRAALERMAAKTREQFAAVEGVDEAVPEKGWASFENGRPCAVLSVLANQDGNLAATDRLVMEKLLELEKALPDGAKLRPLPPAFAVQEETTPRLGPAAFWLAGLLVVALAFAAGLVVWCASARTWWPLLGLAGLLAVLVGGTWTAHINAVPPFEAPKPAPVFVRIQFPNALPRERIEAVLRKAIAVVDRHRGIMAHFAWAGHCPLSGETLDHVACLEAWPRPNSGLSSEALASELGRTLHQELPETLAMALGRPPLACWVLDTNEAGAQAQEHAANNLVAPLLQAPAAGLAWGLGHRNQFPLQGSATRPLLRHNLFPAEQVFFVPREGISDQEAWAIVEQEFDKEAPPGLKLVGPGLKTPTER
jgi:hypothetical protein